MVFFRLEDLALASLPLTEAKARTASACREKKTRFAHANSERISSAPATPAAPRRRKVVNSSRKYYQEHGVFLFGCVHTAFLY